MKQYNNVTIAIFIVILSFLALFFPKTVYAEENINKFGIHILEPVDLKKAQELVNSGGGDWGWVTVVIREDDLNHDKWQDFMNQCREKHLIPLVRIATHLENSDWVKPKLEDSQKWADFLSSLNWPVEDQYVIIFNEPNQAKEWGGEINPKEYSRILLDFSLKFKAPLQDKQNSKFKILNAGLDLAAPNSKTTMDAFRFMQEMSWEVPGIFEKLDGWSSHSYPNHGFVGQPWETGRTSVRGYDWELWILKNHFGLQKELPVFITETGWPKSETQYVMRKTKKGYERTPVSKYLDKNTVANFLKKTFENTWLKDNRVKAVTPFVLNYPDSLFADFSWLDKDGNPYPQFEEIKSLAKKSWWPKQEEKYDMKSLLLPSFMPANTTFKGRISLKNIGQSIWGERGVWEIPAVVKGNLQVSELALEEHKKILPGETTQIDFSISSASESGDFVFSWGNLSQYKLKVLPSSIITTARYTFWERVLLKLKSIF